MNIFHLFFLHIVPLPLVFRQTADQIWSLYPSGTCTFLFFNGHVNFKQQWGVAPMSIVCANNTKHTVQTVDLLLPCIGRIPQMHSCIEKKILLKSLCWLGGKFMLSSSKQVGTGPWFESRTWYKIYIKFLKIN